MTSTPPDPDRLERAAMTAVRRRRGSRLVIRALVLLAVLNVAGWAASVVVLAGQSADRAHRSEREKLADQRTADIYNRLNLITDEVTHAAGKASPPALVLPTGRPTTSTTTRPSTSTTTRKVNTTLTALNTSPARVTTTSLIRATTSEPSSSTTTSTEPAIIVVPRVTVTTVCLLPRIQACSN